MTQASSPTDQQRARPEAGKDEVIIFDPAALEAAATRTDAGPDAVVSRAFIHDVLRAVCNPGSIRLLRAGEAPTPLVIA